MMSVRLHAREVSLGRGRRRQDLPACWVAVAVVGLAGCGTDATYLPLPSPEGRLDAAVDAEAVIVPAPGPLADAGASPTGPGRPPDPYPPPPVDEGPSAAPDAAPPIPVPPVWRDASAGCDFTGCSSDAAPTPTAPRPACLTCQMLGATCGTTPDGCGGVLTCGSCSDALTTCGAELSCVCGRLTALFSPDGDLEPGRRAIAPDLRWYATAAGVFATTTGQMVWPLDQIKGFDWHPTASGRFAQMEHHDPDLPAAVVTVHQIFDEGRRVLPVARATSDRFHHYMAWSDGTRLALGGETTCTTVSTVTPMPVP
jgi:hypothetical protein